MPATEFKRTPQELDARLRQLRAIYKAERSQQGRNAYWVGAYNRWLIVTVDGGRYRLDFFRNCPC